MKNKGITKFWIEIIGGVIIVVIILVIILFTASQTSALIEDAAAVNAFDSFVQTIARARTSGTHTVSPWKLVMSRDDSVYAIVYATQELLGNIRDHFRNLDTESNYTLTQLLQSTDMNDAYLCLFSMHYKKIGITTCDDINFNIIVVPKSNSFEVEKDNIVFWNEIFPLEAFDNIKVLRCISMKTICSWTDSKGTTQPCLIHYNGDDKHKGKPLVWISAQGGMVNLGSINTIDVVDFSVLEMSSGNVNDFYINMTPTLAQGWGEDPVRTVESCKPCAKCEICLPVSDPECL